jgi:23S rRNA (pseudouridine1915-N3)-methyltransferase
MQRIRVIVVDKTRRSFLREGESFYLKRLRRYAKVEWLQVKPIKMKKGMPESLVLEAEGGEIAKKISERDYLVPLDRGGKQYDSEGLAGWLEALAGKGAGRVCFLIGGPLGLAEDILERASHVLSLSKLTLTHEMSRVLLLEQLYRAYTILRGENYHK